MLFGQFVGDWSIEQSNHLEEGRWVSRTGEVHWNWILGGLALQDVWAYHDKDSGELVPSGTTLRFYDRERRLWRSIWIAPRQRDVGLFLGRKVGKEIVLELQEESKNEGEGDLKWIFSEVSADSFSWRAEESHDGGKTWILKQTMRVVRRKATGGPDSVQS